MCMPPPRAAPMYASMAQAEAQRKHAESNRQAAIKALAARGHTVEHEPFTNTYIVDGHRVDPTEFRPQDLKPAKGKRETFKVSRRNCEGCGAPHRETNCPYCGV